MFVSLYYVNSFYTIIQEIQATLVVVICNREIIRQSQCNPNQQKQAKQENVVDGKSITYLIIRKAFDFPVALWNLRSQLGWYLVLVASIIYFIIRKVFDSRVGHWNLSSQLGWYLVLVKDKKGDP